jgi:hypothetical protein
MYAIHMTNKETQQLKQRQRAAKFRADKPWYDTYQATKQKCTNPRHPQYSRFCGVEFKLTQDDMRLLWDRDAAGLSETGLARIDSMGPFSLDNCKLVEKVELTRPKRTTAWRDTLARHFHPERTPA